MLRSAMKVSWFEERARQAERERTWNVIAWVALIAWGIAWFLWPFSDWPGHPILADFGLVIWIVALPAGCALIAVALMGLQRLLARA